MKLPQEERRPGSGIYEIVPPIRKEKLLMVQEYWLVHAGLDHFSETKRLEEYSVEDLVWTRIDYEIPYFNDIIVVSGIHRHRISLGTTDLGYIFKAKPSHCDRLWSREKQWKTGGNLPGYRGRILCEVNAAKSKRMRTGTADP
ncbi:MAG: hypothetical protein ACLVB0_02945 [Fusicatenibacter saccharivorans]